MGTGERVGRPIKQQDSRVWLVEDSTADEAALVDQCRGGDVTAFGSLVRAYQDRVYHLCLRMCGHQTEAEDFAQEAFVRAFQSIERFDGRSKFYTWLFRIAVNLILSDRRRPGRTRSRPLDGEVDGDGAGFSQRNDPRERDPVDLACAGERDRMVHAALAGLDEEQRCIISLRDLESLSYEEIADILNVPAGTVKSRLHRARMALREKLAPHFE